MSAGSELALNTWILTGNAVNEILRCLPASQAALSARVAALEEQLRDVPAEHILDRIATLPADDRNLLIAICDRCLELLGSESQTRLGLSLEEAEPVVTHLRSI